MAQPPPPTASQGGSAFLKSITVTTSKSDPSKSPKTWCLVVSSSSLHKLSQNRKEIVWEVPLYSVHSVESMTADPLEFTLARFSTKKANHALKCHKYVSDNAADRDEFVLVVRFVLMEYWQRVFEKSLIFEPRYYQYHCFCYFPQGSDRNHVLVIDNTEWCIADVSADPFAVISLKPGTAGGVVLKGQLKDVQQVESNGVNVSFKMGESGAAVVKLSTTNAYLASVIGLEMVRGAELQGLQ
eukprot:PhF_6_TR41543/c0_g2_i1/m.62929